MTAPTIQVDNLGKCYILGQHRPLGLVRQAVRRWLGRSSEADAFWAIRQINLTIKPGEAVGIIGGNGAGKSTFLKILSRITEPTEGRATIRGRVGSLLEVGTGFHPELTGRENVYLNGAILGMNRSEIAAKFDQIVEFSGVGAFLDTPVKRYSSGMRVRLGFAVAAHLDPEILIVDEVLAVGDMDFQNRCLGKMSEATQGGRTVLFVSHNMGAIQSLCSRGIVLRKGMLAFDGPVDHAVREYLGHMESTQGLSDDNPHRRGTHQVKMRRVQLIDRNRQPIRSAVAGEPMGIRIGYRNEKGIRQTHVNITFYDDQGVAAMNAGTVYLRKAMELNDSGQITCWIRKLPLIPGRYHLSVGLHDRGEVYDVVPNALYFDIPSSVYYPTGACPERRSTAVMIDHSWECDT